MHQIGTWHHFLLIRKEEGSISCPCWRGLGSLPQAYDHVYLDNMGKKLGLLFFSSSVSFYIILVHKNEVTKCLHICIHKVKKKAYGAGPCMLLQQPAKHELFTNAVMAWLLGGNQLLSAWIYGMDSTEGNSMSGTVILVKGPWLEMSDSLGKNLLFQFTTCSYCQTAFWILIVHRPGLLSTLVIEAPQSVERCISG